MDEKQKPIAYSTSIKKIIYQCPNCLTSFNTLGNKIQFCYNCGIPIDWNVLQEFSKPLSELYEKLNDKNIDIDTFKNKLLEELNIKQLGDSYTKLYDTNNNSLSCNSCTYCIDYEDCFFPEDERKTILIPARNGKTHSAICNKFKKRF